MSEGKQGAGQRDFDSLSPGEVIKASHFKDIILCTLTLFSQNSEGQMFSC